MLESHLSLHHDVEEGCLLLVYELLHFILPWLESMLLEIVEVVEHCERSWILSRFEVLTDRRIKVVLGFIAKGRSQAERVSKCKDGQNVFSLSSFVTLKSDTWSQYKDFKDVAHGTNELQIIGLNRFNERVRSDFLNANVDGSFKLLP